MTIEVRSHTEANALLKEAFPDYQKVRGSGKIEPSGIRKFNKQQRYKKGGAYHKDFLRDKETKKLYGHNENNPHGKYPHINIKRRDKKVVIINIVKD